MNVFHSAYIEDLIVIIYFDVQEFGFDDCLLVWPKKVLRKFCNKKAFW